MYRLHVPDFHASVGNRICLVGRSGAGKTTLLQFLGLLFQPTSIGNFDLARFNDRRLISVVEPLMQGDSTTLSAIRSSTMGFVLQDGGLLPYLTVRENAGLASELAGRQPGDETEARISEIAGVIGIRPLLDRLPAQLSGGERQRAAVLRGLAPQPKILLADEPTAALDTQTSDEVLALLAKTANEMGATTIMVSHNAPLAQKNGFEIRSLEVTEDQSGKSATLICGHDMVTL